MPSINCDTPSKLISLEEAQEQFKALFKPIEGTQTIPVSQSLNRIIACDIKSPISMPPQDNSAMDGYAVFMEDIAKQGPSTLLVKGRIVAGHPLESPPEKGGVYRIFTGAFLPTSPPFDAVIMQENITKTDDNHITIHEAPKSGQNIRRKGEDVLKGQTIFSKGTKTTPLEISLLQAVGYDKVTVMRTLRVAVFSTGDELTPPGKSLQPGKIFDSNRAMIVAALQSHPVEITDLGIIPDNKVKIEQTLKSLTSYDMVITSGGMSVGDEDHMAMVMQEMGVLGFWKLAIKPGKPLGIAKLTHKDGQTTALIGLPGNPVASFVTYSLLVQPWLSYLSNENKKTFPPLKAACNFSFKRRPGRREFLRVQTVGTSPQDLPLVALAGGQGSHVISSLTKADGLLVIPEHVKEVKKHDMFSFLPFRGLLS